ncbi:FAD-dependent monooxygenase [Actinoplanes sp. NPDC051346]|uniref:FAD-dependent monooxygenase n=1 Tax=Actinoplanes sp. NPDC051346 TaxID=3155048 RepID=UPI0034279427
MDELHESTPDVPYPNMWMVPQWRTCELLAARHAELGGTIDFGVAVTGLDERQDGVRVTLSNGEVVTAPYVVGADGGRSTVRQALDIGFAGENYETQTMLIADVRLTGLSRDAWHIWPGPDGRGQRLGLCPLPGTDVWQLTAPLAGSVAEAVADAAEVTEVGWTSRFRANMRMAERYRVGRVFLAGDAAHVHSPAGGQGLNTGIQDAYNLGWKLAAGDDALLDTYEAERLPVAAAVLGISSRLHARRTEDAEEAMRRDDPVLRQLSLHYRGGPLSAEHRREPGSVRAGDRAPDAPCHDAAGVPVRVFDLLRGPHWTLLAFDVPAPALGDAIRTFSIVRPGAAAPGVIVDTDGHAHRAYDVSAPCYVLVRPDNYLGCVTGNPADLNTYLR